MKQGADPTLRDAELSVLGEEPSVDLISSVKEGSACQVLVDMSNGADLLVIGGPAHAGLSSLVPGSVTHAHLNHAQCPVVVVRS
jgi:nucleotide-binding universal stress UspA family protein